jgi:predicted dehydrogenase
VALVPFVYVLYTIVFCQLEALSLLILRNRWSDTHADYAWETNQQLRIAVQVWIPVTTVADQYITYAKDWRIVWNYLRELGPRTVLHKLMSRFRERRRNEKYLALGLGQAVETGGNKAEQRSGDWVVFLACNHPRCVDRLVVDRRLVYPWPYPAPSSVDRLAFYAEPPFPVPGALLQYQGWSPYAGLPIETEVLRLELGVVAAEIRRLLSAGTPPTQWLPLHEQLPVRERWQVSPRRDRRLSGVLFGLGNYAKTALLPNLNTGIRIDCIHEVDPLQLGPVNHWRGVTLDTSGFPRSNERYDVYFIAGYHHTHAPIAIHALRQGACAVVEKPIVTTRAQLDDLRATLNGANARLFCGFHKRYMGFNDFAWQHLDAAPGEAIDYHCIVYEVSLPRRHWYLWPVSGSRIASNGCHWIDHFLYFNDYANVDRYAVQEGGNGDVVIFMELINGATFSMTLTDHGSRRLGVRDYVELRRGHVTVSMTDGSRYTAENTRRVIKQLRGNRMDSYRRMYRTISTRIVDRAPGDDPKTLYSSEVMLMLEEALQRGRYSPTSSGSEASEVVGGWSPRTPYRLQPCFAEQV